MPIRGWSCGGYSFRKYPFAVAVVLGSVCALPAQAQQAPQTEDSVTISVGIKERVFSHARDFAAHYLNYSLHSSNAYENFHESSFDEARQTYTQVTDTEAQFGPEHHARARGIIGRWKLIFGRKGPLQCLDNSVPCFTRGIPIPGLSVLAYKRHSRRDSDVCREIVIAFRGTDARQISDWVSNFRIFTRLLPIDDEYDQVRRNIDHIVRTLTRDRCYREGRTRIIAVGHSLGGGLAQLAGYANNKIRTVYAFNSSPVTAQLDVAFEVRDKNRIGLTIDRVYEHGEVLMYPRAVFDRFSPPTVCDPLIRTVRFNALVGNVINVQHSIDRMSQNLLRWTSEREHRGRRRARELPIGEPGDLQKCEEMRRAALAVPMAAGGVAPARQARAAERSNAALPRPAVVRSSVALNARERR